MSEWYAVFRTTDYRSSCINVVYAPRIILLTLSVMNRSWRTVESMCVVLGVVIYFVSRFCVPKSDRKMKGMLSHTRERLYAVKCMSGVARVIMIARPPGRGCGFGSCLGRDPTAFRDRAYKKQDRRPCPSRPIGHECIPNTAEKH